MKPLLRQIRNEWRTNLFLFVELLLVFTVLWYIVDEATVTARVYTAPMGYDVEHCYTLTVDRLTSKSLQYNPDLTLRTTWMPCWKSQNACATVPAWRRCPLAELQALQRELEDTNELKTRLCVLVFLLVNIFLGVIGTFWFRMQQRRQEVALRMAMGSPRRAIFGRLMTEGLLLLTLAALPAALIAFNIGYGELVDVSKLPFDAFRFFSAILLTWLLMAAMIVTGIRHAGR